MMHGRASAAGRRAGLTGTEDTPKALPQLANRWVGILHACLQRGQFYDETTAWQHPDAAAA